MASVATAAEVSRSGLYLHFASRAEPWTPTSAADLLWALMSVELVDNLRNERAWSTDELIERLRLITARTLLR